MTGEELLLAAVAVRDVTEQHHPEAVGLAQRLVDAAAIELLREQVKP